MSNNSEQLCWSCKNAVPFWGNKCSWAKDFEPVPGWGAEKINKSENCRGFTTYKIYSCPLFEDDTNGRPNDGL